MHLKILKLYLWSSCLIPDDNHHNNSKTISITIPGITWCLLF